MRYIATIALILASTLAVAQTYRWVDPATGKTMISDSPPPGKVKNLTRSVSGDLGSDMELPYATRKAMENFPVVLYTAPDCTTECKLARDYLNKRGIPFSEKMLQKTEDFDELRNLVGGAFVPSLKVGKQGIKGFDEGGYSNVLDLAGYPANALPGSKPSGAMAK